MSVSVAAALAANPVTLRTYLPDADTSTDPAHFDPDELDAIVLDEGFTRRFPDERVDELIERQPVTAHDQGMGVVVYLRDGASPERGLAVQRGARGGLARPGSSTPIVDHVDRRTA